MDKLSLLVTFLVAFITLNVGKFSLSYMKGDRAYGGHLLRLGLLSASLILMINANHLVLFWGSWAAANLFITQLIIHKKEWKAAHKAGQFIGKYFILSMTCMGAALMIFYYETQSLHIQEILNQKNLSPLFITGLSLLGLSGLVQSANWPFHKWLISSLNAPIPVSAVMHAGLINGGGLILMRFSPLYVQEPSLLHGLFIVGTITAIIGSFWKLIQTNIKGTLACSTVAQMGFMIMQCGLGLFPAALTHILWHGMFKAYLFLATGGSAQSQTIKQDKTLTPSNVIASILFGLVGTYCFSLASKSPLVPYDTSLFITVLVLITTIQSSLTLLQKKKHMLMAALAPTVIGSVYGFNMYLIEHFLSAFNFMEAQKLTNLHMGILIIFVALWVSGFFLPRHAKTKTFKKLYVALLNSSQPHPSSITSHHNKYSV